MDQRLPALLDMWQKTFHWQPSEQQVAQFDQLYQAIVEGNKQQNLTRITEPQEFWEKHLWDSLLGVAPLLFPEMLIAELTENALVQKNLKLIDIGTGAGFPSLPIAIANPEWSITMVDSTKKKINFALKTSNQLQLQNIRGLVARAEDLGKQKIYREQYDLALIRAVGQPSVCAEYILPFVKVGGFAILYRGHWQDSDTTDLATALELLGSSLQHIQQTKTPLSDSVRHCLYLYKHSATSKQFPRSVGVPNQHPL